MEGRASTNKRDITCLINSTCVAGKLYYRLTSTFERKLLHGYNLPLSRCKTSVCSCTDFRYPFTGIPTQVANIPGRYIMHCITNKNYRCRPSVSCKLDTTTATVYNDHIRNLTELQLCHAGSRSLSSI